MIETVFENVLRMSFSGSVVILTVLVLRLVLRKAPKVYSYALWALVLLRLLCPVFPEASFSPMPRESTVQIPVVTVDLQTSPVDTPNEIVAAATQSADAQESVSVETNDNAVSVTPAEPTRGGVLPAVWICGMAAMAAYSIWSLIRLRRRLETAVPLEKNVFLADQIDSPFVLGVFRPRIYLPSFLIEGQTAHIIAHERCHIRRLDHWVKILFFAALCLHWFNPMVWAAFILMGHDMEASCDEAVMAQMGADIRAEYAASLLRLSTGSRKITPTPLAFGEGDPKSRIRNVLNYKKPRFWVAVIAVIVCIAAAVLLLTDPAAVPKQDTLYLNYPGLEWGMSPEAVKTALELTDEQIVAENRKEMQCIMKVDGITCFGEEVSTAFFYFTDYTKTGTDYRLGGINLFYPDAESDHPVDMENIKKELCKYYGEPAPEKKVNVVGYIDTEPFPEGEVHWYPSQDLDDYLTQAQKDKLYQLFLSGNAGLLARFKNQEEYDKQWVCNWPAEIILSEHFVGDFTPGESVYGVTSNQVLLSGGAKVWADAKLEDYDGLLLQNSVLNYPRLEWGMTPEEVIAVLEIEDTSITHSELKNGGVKFLTVSGQQYYGYKTDRILFTFTAKNRLCNVRVWFPVWFNMETIQTHLTGLYGPRAESYDLVSRYDFSSDDTLYSDDVTSLWVSEVKMADAFEEELREDIRSEMADFLRQEIDPENWQRYLEKQPACTMVLVKEPPNGEPGKYIEYQADLYVLYPEMAAGEYKD